MGGFIVLFGVSIVVVPMSVSWRQAIGSLILEPRKELSKEKRAPGCLGYVEDEILPSYVGIVS